MKALARSLAGNVALLAVAVLVSCAVAEVAIRLVAPQRLTPAFIRRPEEIAMYQRDSRFGFVLQPAHSTPFTFGTTIRTNALGLRDHEYGPKEPGQFRILSLGDSYAFGYGVEAEQSYAKVLERLLNRDCPGRYAVINAGVSGYGTVQQRLGFDRLRPILRPDLVIATFTAGNDVDDNAIFEDQLRTGLQTPPGLLARHSHLARLVEKVTFPIWFFLANRSEPNIEHTIAMLEDLEADLDSAHVAYLMLLIPARHQIRPAVEIGSRLLMAMGFDGLMFRQNTAVDRHFVDAGVPHIDLWPPLVAEDTVAPVSFETDSHLNPHGHEVVAGVIEAFLRDRLRGIGCAAEPGHLAARAASGDSAVPPHMQARRPLIPSP